MRLHASEYNPFSFENHRILKSIRVAGHEIDHHSEVVDQAAIWEEDVALCLLRDPDVLNRMLDNKVRGVASHECMTGLNNLDFWQGRSPASFGLAYEAYDKSSVEFPDFRGGRKHLAPYRADAPVPANLKPARVRLKYEFIEAHRHQFSTDVMCRYLGVTLRWVLPVVKVPKIGLGGVGRTLAPFVPGIVYREPRHLRGAAGLSHSSEGGRDAQRTSSGPPDARRRPPRTPWLSYAALRGWQAGRSGHESAQVPILA